MVIYVPTLATLANTAISLDRVRVRDLEFMKRVTTGIPEFNGFNTLKAREDGQLRKRRTKAIYSPLIDMPSAEYDTVLTSMLQVQRLTEMAGQAFTVLTFDQQLHRIAFEIQMAHPEKFPTEKFILRIGGMHLLTNFIGAIGNLMADTGLADILAAVFAGTQKMLLGKKFPQCLRALQMVVEALLIPIFRENDIQSHEDLMKKLEKRANQSRTCKLWLDCLIKPMFIMMVYVRAEREGDWLLHVHSVRQMMPYFIAAGHHNYVRSVLLSIRTVENLPEKVRIHFLKGEPCYSSS